MTNGTPSIVGASGRAETPDRRQMLQRLGLVAVAAYAAPTLINLTPARASGGSYSAPSGSSDASGPSRSRASFSGPSGPRRSSTAPARATSSSSSARHCSFSGGGSGDCRVPVRRRFRRPRVFRRLFGGSG